MEDQSFKIVVVGGGTAGWLTSLILRHYARESKLPVDMRVIESSKIPTIGVGEGTTAIFRQTLDLIGLKDTEFVKHTGATVKLGIRHKEWLRRNHVYDGPLDDPNFLAVDPSFRPEEIGSALHIYSVASGKEIPNVHLFGHLMKREKSPYGLDLDGAFIPSGPFEHAYHFDQARVGSYLRSKADDIEIIDDEVVDVELDANSGSITKLRCATGAEISADFFIDCTGFRRQLISGGLGGKWVSYRKNLPVNRAMPFWLEHKEGDEILPFTLAWAREAGWMWAIPTQDRIGCGYVYSDEFLTPEQAQQEIEAAIGQPIEPRKDLKFDSGRLDDSWIGNCLAIGLSSSFLEPLEATSIHGSIVQARLFATEYLPALARGKAVDRKRYNSIVAAQIDDFMVFINLHYTGERDEPFWRHVRENCLHDRTKAMLEHWKRKMPRYHDFAAFPCELPHINAQLYYPVLDGLNHLDRTIAKNELASSPKVRSHARKTTEKFVKENFRITNKCLGHREYLEKVAESSS